ncbi:hypothetical protein BurJ1DRAFT_3153 [Burkholderiales bacterium JOSHI_001]|nr:hypothetical protein BurJ1DRAFT_3153 [Burkholderiales bacterium JOSHI_001]
MVCGSAALAGPVAPGESKGLRGGPLNFGEPSQAGADAAQAAASAPDQGVSQESARVDALQGSPSKHSATGKLLEELREQAGISQPSPAPRTARPDPAKTKPGDMQALPARAASAAVVELDPDMKEALKSARDWVHDTLPSGTLPSGPPVERSAAERQAAPPIAHEPEDQATAARLAAQLRGTETLGPGEPPTHDATVPILNLVAETFRALRDLGSNPITWVVLALLILGRIVVAVASIRNRRLSRPQRRAASPGRAARRPRTKGADNSA